MDRPRIERFGRLKFAGAGPAIELLRSPLETMNPNHSQLRRRWLRFVVGVAFVLAVTLVAPLGYAAWEYTTWRGKMIVWDYGTIDRLCGGDTEVDRLLEIRFVKQWEYKALKRTPDGKEVWLHWKLSKRHCGNWMLVDPSQHLLIRSFEVRFPNGAPRRDAVSCLGIPIGEKFVPRLAGQGEGEPVDAPDRNGQSGFPKIDVARAHSGG